MTSAKIAAAFLMAAIVAGPANGQSTDTPKLVPRESVLRVQAEGQVERMPDYLGVSITLSSRGTTPQQVSAANQEKLTKLVADLRALGIQQGWIAAEGFEASPVYAERNGARDRSEIVGYEARQTLRIEMTDLDRFQPVITRLAEIGYSDLRAAFVLRDERGAQLEAQRKALANARAEAENIAAALGKRVARLLLVANDKAAYQGWENRYGADIVVTGSRIQPLQLKPAPVKVERTVYVDWSLVDR